MAKRKEPNPASEAGDLNERCPFQPQCERRCAFSGHEADCSYYAENADGENVIEGQEVLPAHPDSAPVAVSVPAVMEMTPVQMKPGRSLEVVAAEIRTFTAGMLNNIIEIGRRMVEAKEMLPYGQFGKWIQENTGYSASTANNFMNLYKEYGDMQGSLFGATAESQTFGNLPYTKALALLAVPAEEREAFAKETDAGHISVRELREKIAAYEEEREQNRQKLDQANRKALGKELDAARAEGEAKKATARAEAAEKEAADLREEVEAMKAQPPEVVHELDPLAIADAEQRAREAATAEAAAQVNAAKEAEKKATQEVAALRRELDSLKEQVPDGQVMEKAVKEATEKAIAEINSKLEKAKADKKKETEKRKAAEKSLAEEKARMETELAVAREKAKKDLESEKEKSGAELNAVKKELEKAQAALKESSINSDRDVAEFGILFNQAQETANKMHSILLRVRGKEGAQEQTEKLKNAMTALADAIRRCAE